jgi:hypothetical protein
LKAGAVFLDATAGRWDCPAADPRRAPGRCCFPGRLPGRQCTAPRSHGPVPPRPLPRPQSPRRSCSRCTSPAGTAVSDTSLSGSPRNATRASADKPTATSGSPRRIASRPSATSSATRSASTSTWSRSSRYPPPRSTIAARSSARRSRAICPCIDLRADGGRPLRPQCLLQHVHGHPLTNPRRQCSEHCPFRSRQTNDRRAVEHLHRAKVWAAIRICPQTARRRCPPADTMSVNGLLWRWPRCQDRHLSDGSDV